MDTDSDNDKEGRGNPTPSPPPEGPGGGRGGVDPDNNLLTILLDDAEQRMKAYIKDMKITVEEIMDLTNDELKSLVRQELKSYEFAVGKLQDMKLTLMIKRSKHQELVSAYPSLNLRIHKVCQELVNLSKNLITAKHSIRNEAITRKIKLNKPDYDMKELLSLSTFDGTGASELHFYQWKEQLDQYLSDSNIPEEIAGAVILKHLTGVARAKILKLFPTDSNPNAKVVLEHLRKGYGKPTYILEILIKEAKSVGKIPTHLRAERFADWSIINQRAVKLTKILEKVSNLNRHSDNIGDSSFELVTAFESTIPSDKIEDYNINSTDKTNQERLELIKKILARAEESSLVMLSRNKEEPSSLPSPPPRPPSSPARFSWLKDLHADVIHL